MLKLEEIEGGYFPGSLVLQGINLAVNPGEVIGIIGMNGCGKSTLGKAVMNLLPFQTGKTSFNGKDISNLSPDKLPSIGIRMVMQGGRIFPHMTVWEHLKLAGSNIPENELKKKVAAMSEYYGILNFTSGFFSYRKGSYLSGGEKQQLALFIALINDPTLLILDEPSAGLSPGNLRKVAAIIRKLKENGSMGIILIEQNIKLASELSNTLFLLERGIIAQQIDTHQSMDIEKLNQTIFN